MRFISIQRVSRAKLATAILAGGFVLTMLISMSTTLQRFTQAGGGAVMAVDHNHGDVTEAESASNPSPEPDSYLPDRVFAPADLPAQEGLLSNDQIFAQATSRIDLSTSRTVHLFELPGFDGFLACAGSGNSKTANLAGSYQCERITWSTTTSSGTSGGPVSTTMTRRSTLNLPSDWFCGAGVYLADGRLLFSGGTGAKGGYPDPLNNNKWLGAKNSYIYTPASNAITATGQMKSARWYNGIVRNWFSNDSYTYGGIHNGAYVNTWEVMKSGTTTWQQLPWQLKTYNYADYKVLGVNHLAYTGVSTSNSSGTLPPHVLDVRNGSRVTTTGLRSPGLRNAGAAIMLYPAQKKAVAVIGGGSTASGVQATNLVDQIDYGVWPGKTPSFIPKASMPANAMFVLATNLPNGQVFATGGTTLWRTGQQLWAGIYTPSTDSWSLLPPPKVGRNYHSTIYTRLDGRPMTFGGNPSDGSFESRTEVFSPWYESRPAPVIGTFTKQMKRGSSYNVNVSFPAGTTFTGGKVTLESPRATTHSASDANYGLFSISAVATSTGVKVTVPTDGSLPPGYYKLSVVTGGPVTESGPSGMVPSNAVWIQIM